MNLDITVVIMIVIIFTLLTSFTTYFITKKLVKKEKEDIEVKRTDEDVEPKVYQRLQEEIKKYKETDEYKAILHNKYLEGIEDGRRGELSKFEIRYDTFIREYDSFFKKRAESGYTMQLLRDGMPIGDATERILDTDEKFKDENVKFLVDALTANVNGLVNSAIKSGLQAKSINNVPKRIRAKKT